MLRYTGMHALSRLWLILLLTAALDSCRPGSEEYLPGSEVHLRFSADTVFFDTLFTEIPSITRRLRVYNDRERPVLISEIRLADPGTPYLITVNGRQGTRAENTLIRARDSILILLEARLPAGGADEPFVVEDRLQFSPEENLQEVIILAWGQDAHYLKDSVLTCNTTWTAGKPYLLFNDILVDSLCTLTLQSGTRVYAHRGGALYVKGRLLALGTASDPVVFANDRFDGSYATAPGQWQGLVFLPGSTGNRLRFAEVRNAVNGIWLGTPDNDTLPDLVLENTRVINMQQSAVLAFTSDLEMTNCLVANAGDFVLAGLAGGHYRLLHNTLANEGIGLSRTRPVMAFSDRLELSDGTEISGPLALIMVNNIVWGTGSEEIVLLNETAYPLLLTARHNLLRTTDQRFAGNNNLLNLDPLFADPYNLNYRPDTLSPAIDTGLDTGLAIDLDSLPRTPPPDIGAYERMP